MFGTNQRVGKEFFNKQKEKDEGKLYVTSMFYTLQGEGPFRGEPAFFLRLAKCNLDCSFCDTYFGSGDWMSIDEIEDAIFAAINKFFNGNVPRWADFHPGYWVESVKDVPDNRGYVVVGEGSVFVQDKHREMTLVITGGEPTLQDNLGKLLERMQYQFKNTQIESNGMLIPPVVDSTTVVISPKCVEKNGVALKYLKPNATALSRANCLKFVMSADADSPYNSVPDWAHEWWRETGKAIFVSPMNIYKTEPKKAKELRAAKQESDITLEERSSVDEVISFWEEGLLDMEANRINHEYTAQYAIRHGFIFNLQQHLFASVA